MADLGCPAAAMNLVEVIKLIAEQNPVGFPLDIELCGFPLAVNPGAAGAEALKDIPEQLSLKKSQTITGLLSAANSNRVLDASLSRMSATFMKGSREYSWGPPA